MIDIKSRWSSVTNREKWAARGATFVAKAKATKAVWFPPKPVDAGRKAGATAKKATKRTAKKTSGAAKKTTGAAKKSGAAKKTTAAASSNKGTKKVTSPVRRKQG